MIKNILLTSIILSNSPSIIFTPMNSQVYVYSYSEVTLRIT